MKISSNYINLSDLTRKFKSGYIIIGNTLFEVDDKHVSTSYPLDGKTIEEKVISARKEADLDNYTRIYYDDEDLYDEDIVSNEERLVTDTEADELMDDEESEGWNDIAEHFSDN